MTYIYFCFFLALTGSTLHAALDCDTKYSLRSADLYEPPLSKAALLFATTLHTPKTPPLGRLDRLFTNQNGTACSAIVNARDVYMINFAQKQIQRRKTLPHIIWYAIAQDACRGLFYNSQENALALVNTTSDELMRKFEDPHFIGHAALSGNGDTVVYATNNPRPCIKVTTINDRDQASQDVVRIFFLGHTHITSLVVSQMGRKFCINHHTDTISLYNITTQKLRASFQKPGRIGGPIAHDGAFKRWAVLKDTATVLIYRLVHSRHSSALSMLTTVYLPASSVHIQHIALSNSGKQLVLANTCNPVEKRIMDGAFTISAIMLEPHKVLSSLTQSQCNFIHTCHKDDEQGKFHAPDYYEHADAYHTLPPFMQACLRASNALLDAPPAQLPTTEPVDHHPTQQHADTTAATTIITLQEDEATEDETSLTPTPSLPERRLQTEASSQRSTDQSSSFARYCVCKRCTIL